MYQLICAVMLQAATASVACQSEAGAVNTLEEINALITRDEDQPGKPVIEVSVRGVLTAAAWKELAGLKQLRLLTISTCLPLSLHADAPTPEPFMAGLKGLAGLKNLQSLTLITPEVADASLKEIARLTNLRTLDLGSTRTTDAGLKQLVVLK